MAQRLTSNPISYKVFSSSTNNSQYLVATGLTISNYPAQICAVENPILWRFSSDTIQSGAFIPALGGLEIGTIPPDGIEIIISASTAGDFPTYILTSAANPNVNEYYSTGSTPTKTAEQVADSIVYALNANFSFRQRFFAVSILSGLWNVLIFALEDGTRWNFDININTTYFVAISQVDSYDRYKSQLYNDWGLWGNLYINSVGDFGSNLNRFNSLRVAQSEIGYNTDNDYYLDASGIIKNYVSTPLPTMSATTMQVMNDALVNAFWVFGERYDEYDNNFRRQFLNGQTNIIWGLNSSLDKLATNDLTAYTFNNSYSGQTFAKFLTLSPDSGKNTYINSHEFLSFLYYNNSSGTTQLSNQYFIAQVDLNYVDGTSDVNAFEILPKSSSGASGGLYCMDVSPYQFISSAIFNTKLIDGYTIRLLKQSGSVSAGTSYQLTYDKDYKLIDDCPSEGQQEIQFLNSLGGWDTYMFNAQLTTDANFKVTSFDTPVNYYPSLTDKVKIQDNIDFSKKQKLYSSFMNEEHFNWLKDLIKTTDARLIQDTLQIPINITSVDWKKTSSDDLFSIAIEYVLSTSENYVKQ